MQPNTPTNSYPSTEPVLPVTQNKPSRSERWRGAGSTILVLIAAPLIAIMLTSFVFQSYEVDGQSMETTLQHKDRLIILKVQRTWSRITKNTYTPNRGDVVVFVRHGLAEVGSTQERQLIKRVIGLPGDRVVIKDGTITVYNKEYPAGFQPDKTLPYGEAIVSTPGDKTFEVEEGQVFVCGDNRANSLDSRTFGPIESKDIVGKLAVRILPVGNSKLF